MNSKVKVFASALALTVLAGCTDATAKLPDSSTALFSVGNKTITKGDVYSLMNSTSGASTAINEANKVIARAEIEVTDEMKESAESTLESYKTYYGDTFTTYLEQMGLTDEEYLNDYLIPSLQAEKLSSKYVDENFAQVISTYMPIKATLLTFTTEDDANKALSELKDGSKDAATAAKDNNSTSTGTSTIYTIESTDIDSTVRTVLNSAKPEDGWTMVPASDSSSYVVLKVDDHNPDNFRDEAAETLGSLTNVQNDSTTYWFKKYGFHIYDKTIYDAVAADYPDNLVQNLPADETE
ncbi:MAG: hypothetical protein IJM63_07195 [Solobacterium sp.]|nr:hypothetical protein [Solobacterium sp.]MBQ9824269.1 hypothetical protein [Solobacterium sp.]